MKRGSLIGALCLLVIIAVVSALPTQDKFVLHTQGLLHPWLHMLAFGTLTFLLASGLRTPALRIIAVVLMIAFGWGSEYVEHLRDSWPVESRDVLLDAAGTLLGGLLAIVRPTES